MQDLNDKDIRAVLFDHYEFMGKRLRLFEEMNIGKSRADAILILDNQLIGFEIKSDRDSLDRLPEQIKNYSKYCNENYIVTGNRLLDKVEQVIPKEWGIYHCFEQMGQYELICIKQSQPNPKVKLKNQLSLLWRNELMHIAKKYKIRGLTKRNRKKLAELLIERLEETVIMAEMCEELMEREYRRGEIV